MSRMPAGGRPMLRALQGVIAGFVFFLAASLQPAALLAATEPVPGYQDLLAVYREFRELARPVVSEGVPDYSRSAMQAQAVALSRLRARLDAIDDSDWPIPRRADYLLVLAEMRGLDFMHRVMRPWERDPAFYSSTNLGFGPKMYGAMRIPALPLSADEAEGL